MRLELVPPLMLLLASSCTAASPEHNQTTALNGSIAFLRVERLGPVPYDVREGIYIVDPDGTPVQQLLDGPDGALYGRASWSADGTRLVFPRLDGHFGPSKLLVMQSDGTELTSILSCRKTDCAWDPAWSPDGDRLAFVRGLNIYSMAVSGGRLEQLTNCPPDGDCYIIEGLSWSPDGNRIAFARMDRQWVGAIYVMEADGSDLRQLTSCDSRLCKAGQRDAWPAWSPDGSKIAFARERNIWIMETGGQELSRLTDCPARRYIECNASSPAWSPDGTKILFMQAGWIYVMNADGTQTRKLVEGSVPAWQPLTEVK